MEIYLMGLRNVHGRGNVLNFYVVFGHIRECPSSPSDASSDLSLEVIATLSETFGMIWAIVTLRHFNMIVLHFISFILEPIYPTVSRPPKCFSACDRKYCVFSQCVCTDHVRSSSMCICYMLSIHFDNISEDNAQPEKTKEKKTNCMRDCTLTSNRLPEAWM